MTLQEINRRLDLFPEYLKYRIDAKFTQLGFTYTPEYILNMFQKHGFMITLRDIGVPLLTFDQWLLLYGWADLSIEPEIITIGVNPMLQVVKHSGQNVPYEILGSFDMFKDIELYMNRMF